MKAIRIDQFGGPEVLKLEEIPDPKPGPQDILVRVRAAGVNPVDTYLRAGSNLALELPYTPGMDAAGIVEAAGSEVRRFKIGDRVYTGTGKGGYAELLACKETEAHPLPEHLSFEQGAAVHVNYATAYRALFQRAHAKPREVVLVHGASGGVGVAAVQVANASGLTVIGTGGTEKGRQLVRDQGAAHVLDHHSSEYRNQVMSLTGGRGVDVILEMLANVNLGKDLPLLAPGGRVVVIGSRGNVEITPRDLMTREASVTGMVLMNTPEKELFNIHGALEAGLKNGTLKPVAGRQFPMAEAARAHEAVMAPGAYGKIVLIPN